MPACPNSAGSGAPSLAVPADACDAHMHVLDRRFAFTSTMVDGATASDYRLLQQRLGTRRTVVVTPRTHGTDNRVTLDAIARLGAGHTRGVAVLRPDVTDAQLQALHDGGIRGVRFTLYTPTDAVTSFDMVAPLADRVRALGWHVQLHWTAEQIVEHAALLGRLSRSRVVTVFDHLARLGRAGTGHPAFRVVASLVDAGSAWIKLSGAYLDARAADCRDVDDTARAWARRAPERVVWGSDWPHTTESDKPDDAALLDLLGRWVDGEAARHRVLVDNAAALYDFPLNRTHPENP